MRRLKDNSCCTVGYEGDIANLVSRKFLNTVSELLKEALSMREQ
jgi:hypothetical protein